MGISTPTTQEIAEEMAKVGIDPKVLAKETPETQRAVMTQIKNTIRTRKLGKITRERNKALTEAFLKASKKA